MNKSLAAIAAAAMLAASLPVASFADESSSSSTSTSSVSSASSTSVSSASTSSVSSATVSSSSVSSHARGNEWMKPCDDLKGLLKAQCIVKHNPGKKTVKKDRVQRMNDEKILKRAAKCDDKESEAKVQCLRKTAIKAIIKKAVKKEIIRTIRGKTQD